LIYKDNSKQIKNRIIKLVNTPINKLVNTPKLIKLYPINKLVKDNSTSLNNTNNNINKECLIENKFNSNKQLNNIKEKEKSSEKKEKENLIQTKEKEFNEFWSLYPLKKSKQKAKLLFMKLNLEQEIVITSLQNMINEHDYKKSKNEWTPEYKHPTTRLNQ
jgi:hypothetical protein